MVKRKKGRRKSSREVVPEHELPGGFWRQVSAVLMIAISIVLVMTWFGSGGTLLNDFHKFGLWLIGYATFAIPVILVYLAVKIFRTTDNRLPAVIWVVSFLMIFWLSGLFGLPTYGNSATQTGGILGVWLNSMVTQILNPSVAAFIYLVLIFITAIFILQLSPAAVFRDIANIFKTTKRDEDAENARIARRAQAEDAVNAGALGPLKIKANGVEVTAEELKAAPKIEVKKPVAAAPVEAEPERALIAVSDPNWKMPSTDLLSKKQNPPDGGNIQQNAFIINSTFADFGIEVKLDGANVGPRVTQYTIQPPTGVVLSKIAARDKELALNLAVDKVRIEAPIPGTRLVGIEIPNVRPADVTLRSILESNEWKKETNPLSFAVGKDISGNPVIANLAKMPHLLIAGTTGSGKSVLLNAIVMSMLMRATPEQVRLIMVDPKRVEFTGYAGLPHLYVPVVTEPRQAASALQWGVTEMERRLKVFEHYKVRDIKTYNRNVDGDKYADMENPPKHMPYFVIVIDELADLMMVAGKDVESSIVRIAQLGRAAGIHLIVATQRPSADVVTGLIRANIDNRVALSVDNSLNSRIILDQKGAEQLLGKGDMLVKLRGKKPNRAQGCWVSDEEIEDTVKSIRTQRVAEYHDNILTVATPTQADGVGGVGGMAQADDPLIWEAARIIVDSQLGSTSSLQRALSVGYARAGRIMDMLEAKGVVGPANGSKPREVLIDKDALEELKVQDAAYREVE